MSQRMIDQIWQQGTLYHDPQTHRYARAHVQAFLRPDDTPHLFMDAQVFVMDNVTRYLYSTRQDVWYAHDFPNVAPAYPVMWLETRAPHEIHGEDGTIQPWNAQYAWGVLLVAYELAQMPGMLDDMATYYQHCIASLGNGNDVISVLDPLPQPAEEIAVPDLLQAMRWGYCAYPFVQQHRGGEIYGPLLRGLMGVRPDGQLYTFTHGAERFSMECWHSRELQGWPDAQKVQLMAACRSMLFPFWLGLTFLHARNVSTQRVDPCHPKGHKRAGLRCARLHYHTLDVQPMTQMLRQTASTEQRGITQALHARRGHFRDYRMGNGLFGKHHGLYWFGETLAGTSTHGITTKDYAVHTP